MKKRYVNIIELSEYTSISRKTLYDWSGQGRIPSIKIGRKVLFDLNDIDNLLLRMKRDVVQCDKVVNKVIESVHSCDSDKKI